MLTHEQLCYWLHYNPDTGIFIWKDCPAPSLKLGDNAGFNHLGYVRIRLKGKLYLAHVLAWFYVTKQWPATDIDHKNGIRSDNRFDNLRLSSYVLNGLNLQKPIANNTSGYLGVSWHKNRRVWVAQIKYNKRYIHLGCYKDKEEAAKVVAAKRAELIKLEEAKLCNAIPS